MPKGKVVHARVTQEDKESIKERWTSLGFWSESEYVLALLRADIPSMDPARKLKGLKGR